MVPVQQQKAAKEFADRWKGKGYEKGESQKFWTTLLTEVFGIEHVDSFLLFEQQVKLDHTSFIDGAKESSSPTALCSIRFSKPNAMPPNCRTANARGGLSPATSRSSGSMTWSSPTASRRRFCSKISKKSITVCSSLSMRAMSTSNAKWKFPSKPVIWLASSTISY